jgi:anthranilate phosphoribosyltransferase
VLEALGVNVNMTPDQVATCIDEVGVGFMFAPNHHSAMKHAAPVRRELGMRTLFNILGPLTNPAGAPNQVMGVFHPDLVGILARVLQRTRQRSACSSCTAATGLDEISIGGDTLVGELRDGEVREYTVHPEQFGVQAHDIAELRVETVGESKDRVLKALDDTPSAERDIVALNAGAAIYAAGVADSLSEGVERARAVMASGGALAKLAELAAYKPE